jgi:N-acetylglutamate synthase-like GNAT family acetyltransferase
MTVVCRAAQLKDLDDINVLFQSATRDALAFSNRQEIVFKRLVKEDLLDVLIVEKDEYVVGCCHFAVIPTLSHGGRPYAVLNHFLIDPLNRKQGLAKLLLKYAIATARQKGCYQVYLSIDEPKAWQQALLARFGFQKNGFFTLSQ